MTLILTWFSQQRITQVTDTRISYTYKGKPVLDPEDVARKCLFLATPDAHCVIAYTGLLCLCEHPQNRPLPIEDWITRQVAKLPHGSTLPDVVRTLTQQLDAAVPPTLRRFRPPQSDHLTLTLSGFSLHEEASLLICISNHLEFGHVIAAVPIGSAPVLALPRAQKPSGSYGAFTYTVGIKRNSNLSIMAHGDLLGIKRETINPLWRTAKKLHAFGAPDGAVRKLLVIMLRSARTWPASETVGRDCWSVSLRPEERIATVDVHLEHDPIVKAVLPRLIGPQLAIGPVFLGKNNVPSDIVTRYRSLYEAGDYRVPITQDSLGAYVELSRRLGTWLSYIQHLGYNIGPVGALDRAVTIVVRAGMTSIVQIDEMLRACEGWGHALIQEFLENSHTEPNTGTVDRVAPIIMLTIGKWPDVFTDTVLESEFGWGLPDRITGPARRYNPRGHK